MGWSFMSVTVIHEKCDLEKDNNNKLPYTAYVIQYEVEGNLIHDIAMAQKAVDIPDAKCHWYIMSPDNTFGEGFDWENAPWFDANGLNDIAPMQAQTVVEKLQKK